MNLRPSGSFTFPNPYDDLGLAPTEEVLEQQENLVSSILGPDGQRLAYRSKKPGFIGFTKLKERP